MKLTETEWLELVGLKENEIPDLLILEGTWWEKKSYNSRLAYLESVRELAFPNMYIGTHHNKKIMFCCAYGAPRAVEPVHIFGSLGTPAIVQIGSCGSLQPNVRTGDIVLPDPAKIGEGASQYYGASMESFPDSEMLQDALRCLGERNIVTHKGPHLTTSALFQQSPNTVQLWSDSGLLAVDMETSAIFSAAQYFEMKAVSLIFVWDELLKGRTWLDKFTTEEVERQEKANRVTFEVALSLN